MKFLKIMLLFGIFSVTALAEIKTAYLAGGCFWCTESDMEKVPGVLEVFSGYSGGEVENPSYKEVSSGMTGHIESIMVRYDDKIITYPALLNRFLKVIDPTDGDGSFVDRGYQYSPAIFYQNESEREEGEMALQKIKNEGKFENIAVKIIPLKNFYSAEEYHQDYAKKNPLKYSYYRSRSGRDDFLEKVWGEKK